MDKVEKFKELLGTLVECLDETTKQIVIEKIGGKFETKYSVKQSINLINELEKMYQEAINEKNA